MNYLLDANTLIDHLRKGAASNVSARMLTTPPESIFLCSVVVGELIYGALHSPTSHQAANLASIRKLQKEFTSLPFDDNAAEQYGIIREHLASLGTPIGTNDLLIAAIAKANGLKLVTHNTREFSRVPGLDLEDWQ